MNKEYLKLFWDDIEMRKTVREALFENLDYKVKDLGTLTNEQIGAEARAVIRAKEILSSKFNSLSQFGTQDSKVENSNPAL